MTIKEQLEHAREDDYITVQQFALLLGVSTQTVYRRIWAEEIPAVRVGRVLRIPTAEAIPKLKARYSNDLPIPQ